MTCVINYNTTRYRFYGKRAAAILYMCGANMLFFSMNIFVCVMSSSVDRVNSHSKLHDIPGNFMVHYRVAFIVVGLVFMAGLAGCGSGNPIVSRGSTLCALSPSSCLYDGRYEPGERDYAEREAIRLNQAALERLRAQ